MTQVSLGGGNLGPGLKSIIERIEALEESKKGVSDDIKELYAEAKGNGYDVPTIKAVIRLRKLDADERAEQEHLRDVYLRALGLLDDITE